MSGINCVGAGYLKVDTTAKYIADASTGSTGSTGALGIPSRAKGLRMKVHDAGVRLWMDGTIPTATAALGGEVINSSGVLELKSWDVPGQNWRSVMQKIQVISTGAASTSNIVIHYFD